MFSLLRGKSSVFFLRVGHLMTIFCDLAFSLPSFVIFGIRGPGINLFYYDFLGFNVVTVNEMQNIHARREVDNWQLTVVS